MRIRATLVAYAGLRVNEAPNRNDATGVANNVRLITMGAIQLILSGGCVSSNHTEKSTYQR